MNARTCCMDRRCPGSLSRCLPIALAIFLLALILRLWGLSEADLGADAVLSLETALKPDVPAVISHVREVHQGASPLDFILLHLWIGLAGASNLSVQIPALVWSLLGLLAAWRLAARLFGERTALWALFILAISPMHVYFSQEARYYALFMFLSTTALLLYFHISDDARPSRLLIFAAVAIAGLYAHYFMAIVLALIWFHALSSFVFSGPQRRSKARRMFVSLSLSLILSGLAFLPWYVYKAAGEYMNATRNFGLESLSVYGRALVEFSGTGFINHRADILPAIFGLIFFGVGIVILHRDRSEALILPAGMLLSLVAVYYVCFRFIYYPTTRQWFFTLPWFALIQARGISFLLQKASTIERPLVPCRICPAFIALILVFGPAVQLYDYYCAPTSFTSLRAAAAAGLEPEDVLVGAGLAPDNVAFHLRYAGRNERPARTVLNADQWLYPLYETGVDPDAVPEHRVIFVSEENISTTSAHALRIPPWYYHVPAEGHVDTHRDLILRFIAIQLRAEAMAAEDRRALRVFPSEALRQAALGCLVLGDGREAESLLLKSIRSNPLRRDARHLYATFLMRDKRYNEAEIQWRAALKAVPPRAEDRVGLARLQIIRKQYGEAESLLREALRREPSHPWALFYLRQICLDTARLEEARAIGDDLLSREDLDPVIRWRIRIQNSDTDLMKYLARLRARGTFVIAVGFDGEALALRDALMESGNQAEHIVLAALEDLPEFIRGQGRFSSRRPAVLIAAESLEGISPHPVEQCGDLWATTPPEFYTSVQQLLRDGIKIQEGIDARRLTGASDIQKARAAFHRALLYEALPGDILAETEALRLFQEAVGLAPGDAWFRHILARHYLEKDRPADALEQIEKAIALSGPDAEKTIIRIRSLERLGRSAEAFSLARIARERYPDHPWLQSRHE